MFETLETGIGLDVVIWLQAHSNPLLNALAQVMYGLGSVVAYVLVVAIALWVLNRRLGLRLMVVMLAGLTVTDIAKVMLGRPRPFQVAPDLVHKLVPIDGTGYGFPSGHVLLALVVVGYLTWTIFRDWRAGGSTALYVAVMGWSRMAAGVHYPQDVLGGLVLGSLLLIGLVRYLPAVTGWLLRLHWTVYLGLLGGAVVLVVLLTAGEGVGLRLAGLLLGMGIAVLVERRSVRMAPGGPLAQQIARAGLGLVFVVGVFGLLTLLMDPLPAGWHVLRYAAVPLAALAIWPWLCVRVGLASAQTARA